MHELKSNRESVMQASLNLMQASLNGSMCDDEDSGQEDVDSDIPFQTRAFFTCGILVSELFLAFNISMVRNLPSPSLPFVSIHRRGNVEFGR